MEKRAVLDRRADSRLVSERRPKSAARRTGIIRAGAIYCFQKHGKISKIVMPANPSMLMTANEAASATGVPLRQVHRIIDAGLLGGAVKRRRNARLLTRSALVGLK